LSTILKALKRLDEQRRADLSPRTLEEQVLAGGGPEGNPTTRVRRSIWIAGAGLVLVAVGGASYLWISREQTAPVATAAPEPVAAPPALPQAVATAQRESLPARGAPIAGTELDESVRSALRPEATRGDAAFATGAASARPAHGHEPEPTIGTEPDRVAAATTPPAPAPAPAEKPRLAARSARATKSAPAPAELPREPAVQTPQVPRTPTRSAPAEESAPTPSQRDEGVALTEPAPAPAAPPARDVSEPASAPAREPEVALVRARPEVWVESTEWHPSPAKRSARVRVGEDEARNLHEGDAVDGVSVKEIRPSGVLFLYEGAEFKRGVGSG